MTTEHSGDKQFSFTNRRYHLGPSPRQREEADDAHWLGIDGRVRTLVQYPFFWLSLQRDDEIEMMTAASLANEANMDVAGTTTPASTGSEIADYGSDDIVEE